MCVLCVSSARRQISALKFQQIKMIWECQHQIYGRQRRQGYQLSKQVLNATYEFITVPNDHPIYHARNQGLYSPSGWTSCSKISWSLEAATLDVIMIVSLWDLAGISTALLSRCLSNLRLIEKSLNLNLGASRLHEILWKYVHPRSK